MDRYQEVEQGRYVLPVVQFAQFASFWANIRIPKGNKLTSPGDFIPDLNKKPEPPDPVRDSLRLISMWEAAYPESKK